MKKIIIIAKKEFLDMFRDRRTLMRMILIPLVAFPIIINLVTTIQEAQSKKQATKELKVGYYLNGQSADMIENMEKTEHYVFVPYTDSVQLRKDVKQDSINLGMKFSATFDQDFESGKQASYEIFYREADNEEYSRLKGLLAIEENLYIQKRLAKHELPTDYFQPFHRIESGQSESKEVFGKYAGGILPYIFMAFCFMGCMLPAIDLFAGEKERGTIETLLVTPVNRAHVLIGKMIVVTSFGLLSATVALVGLVGSLYLMGDGGKLTEIVSEIITPQLIITLYLLLIPVAVFFAGIMIPISVYARSFKEAQSILTPLNIAVIVPTMVGFVPGLELDYTTAFIPIVNVVLATKSIIAGNAELVPLIITFMSLLILSAVAIFISVRQFGREQNVLR